MKTKIYLVRHTQTVGNIEKRLSGRTDFELTLDGKKYVEKLTNRLKNIKFDKAYSSISGRAVKTIEPICKLQGLEIEKTDKLCEMDFGIYDGLKWEEVNKINPKIKQTQDEINEIAGIPGQESTEEVANRMFSFIRTVSIQNTGKVILMSSHGVAIEAFIRKVNHEKFSENKEANIKIVTSKPVSEGTLEINNFGGQETIQINIKDMMKSI